jgi:hypothetical protein
LAGNDYVWQEMVMFGGKRSYSPGNNHIWPEMTMPDYTPAKPEILNR